MTTKNALGAIAMAALLVLAGCSSAVPGSTTNAQATTDGAVDDGQSMDSTNAAALTFYVSDRPGAIDDFEHLNVTITKIGLHEADGGEDGDDANETDTDDEASETDSANDTADASMDAADVDTTTVDDPNETTVEMTTTEETETEADDSEDTETESEEDESEDTETEEDDSEDTESEEDDSDEDESGESKAGWVTKDVDNRTVDLTNLKGANATAIGNLSVPAGEYDKVFVYVSDINATLTNGESVNVKLPSSKLQINKEFELTANSTPDFVFDINVHKAGNSGKYILRPIVSESGTGDQVEIREVDENGKPVDAGANGKAKGKQGGDDDGEETDGDDADETEDGESDESALEASLDGQVRAGETVTLSVTDANGSVANATVEVNGETAGETAADGTLAFEVPDTEELEVEVTKDDAEVELERDVKGGNGNGNGNDQQLSGYALAAA
ncbi:DUF4382 domain-containing protein [Halorubellus sp. JP-L1]|uniref:DUF4382 domain-containing protein n=1 Tax=Halorubellus sp. JP-L1 TaxID=2715753 RepID=UPI00140E5ABD|nr:DUF4382 domain-containing protein [Halorubellus sp. JP-L1]NHN43540.1 DUF4382 domain-containing protein [Halorubellus sp. JP-L1]